MELPMADLLIRSRDVVRGIGFFPVSLRDRGSPVQKVQVWLEPKCNRLQQ